jgi:RNA polymerase sigma-70 factor (ECF subfamily)
MICSQAELDVETGAASRGDIERRFQTLLEAHGAALGRVAGSYARGSGDRDDLLQEIAIAIWRALPGFRGECSERTFLFRIAHNRGLSYLARRRRGQLRGQTGVRPGSDPGATPDVPDTAPGPEATLSATEESRRLHQAIARLPLPHRQVITLALEGLSYAEIAQVLGLSESNVGVRLTRARQMLRRLIDEVAQRPLARATARVGGG